MPYTNTGSVLIDFWSPQCGPCVQLSPIIDEIKKENPNIEVIKINVLENMDEALKYGVRSLPTLIFLKNGEVVNKMMGLQSKEDIVKALKGLEQ
jgi:thioredoxin 1